MQEDHVIGPVSLRHDLAVEGIMDGAVAFPRRLLPQPVQVARRHAVPDARHALAVSVIGVVLRPGGAGDLLEEAFVVPEICPSAAVQQVPVGVIRICLVIDRPRLVVCK